MNYTAHASQPHTLPSRSKSQPHDQNLSKSVSDPTHGRQDIAAKLIDNEIKRQKSPVPNKRYKTLGFRWLCEVPTTHQSLVYLDMNVARTPQRFHTADRYAQKPNIDDQFKL